MAVLRRRRRHLRTAAEEPWETYRGEVECNWMAGVRATQDDGAPATMTPRLGWARLFPQRQASVLTGRLFPQQLLLLWRRGAGTTI